MNLIRCGWVVLLLFSGWCYGQGVVVSDITITGNEKTREPVILRELTFQEGDSLDVKELIEKLGDSQQNVNNLRLFNEVILDTIHRSPREVGIHIRVTERWYVIPYPYVSLEERNTFDIVDNPNLRRFVYGLDIEWRNITGRGEYLTFGGQLGFSQRIDIEYRYPALIRKGNVDFLSSFNYRRTPEIIYRVRQGKVEWGNNGEMPLQESYDARVGLRKRFTPRRSLRGTIGLLAYNFADTLFELNPRYLAEATNAVLYPDLRVQFTEDQRGYRSFPLDGYRLQLFFRRAGIPGSGPVQFTKLGLSWSHHLPLSRRWNFAYGTHTVYTFGDQVPFYEKSFMGINLREFAGLGYTLRGYQPYAVGGDLLNRNQFELKYAIFPVRILSYPNFWFKPLRQFPMGIYLSAFTDVGYVQDRTLAFDDDFLTDRWLTGYGVGLNIVTVYDFLIRVEYAWNHLGDSGFYFHGSVSIR